MKSGIMLRELLKDKIFKKIIGKGLENEEVLDIILFGSVVRGKERPNDIDILIVYKTKDNLEYNQNLRKNFEQSGFKVHISGQTYEGIFSSGFLAREGILSDGYSLKRNVSIHSSFGFSSYVIFRYSLRNMSNSEKMIFYYGLYGRRGEKGILDVNDSVKFADNVLIAPFEKSEEIKKFLDFKKINFSEMNVLIPARFAEKRFLEAK